MARCRSKAVAVVALLLGGLCVDAVAQQCIPDQCANGFVWREAFPGDHVCVTGTVRRQAVDDNAKAASRRVPGSETCVPGFVWREASPSDHVCVNGAVRSAAWADNAAAPGRLEPACAGSYTIKGAIQFTSQGRVWPAASAEIELWFCGNWLGSLCGWNKLTGGKTDELGNYAWSIPGQRDIRDQYQVRVYARNAAAIVWQQDTGTTFWADVAPQAKSATAGNHTIVISRTFGSTGNDLFVSQHLNAAQKLLDARDFAMRFRDDSETDTLGRVIVAPALATGTAFTNSGVIRVNPASLFDDATLTHEYGHFVQESIGAYYLWPSFHDTCFIGDRNTPANTPEFAWFEGFPEFFSKAVRMYFPGNYDMPITPRTLTLPSAFSPTPCGAIGMNGPGNEPITPESVENRVTDMLFLLLNDSGPAPICAGRIDANYPTCARPVWDKNARLIMSIFDKELDFSQPNPVNVHTFALAWVARGGSKARLDAAMTAVGMTPLPNIPVPRPPTPHALCVQACNRELDSCMQSASSGIPRAQCVREGQRCRALCPP